MWIQPITIQTSRNSMMIPLVPVYIPCMQRVEIKKIVRRCDDDFMDNFYTGGKQK